VAESFASFDPRARFHGIVDEFIGHGGLAKGSVRKRPVKTLNGLSESL
jgi:hypothetical protein